MVERVEREGVPLAYAATPGAGPGVVFLGGFRSDMTGTKALALEAWARERGRAFLRLDYGGHGASGGTFEAGDVATWRDDALAVIAHATTGPQVLVGSSMGGWIALLIARDRPDLVAGLVTVAAAPDFTEDMWAAMDETQRVALFERGHVLRPSDYGEPYVITRHLIEAGRDVLVLDRPLRLSCPVRCLQGTADADVPVSKAVALLAHAEAADMELTLVNGADHRFSDARCLDLVARDVEAVLARAAS